MLRVESQGVLLPELSADLPASSAQPLGCGLPAKSSLRGRHATVQVPVPWGRRSLGACLELDRARIASAKSGMR
jgi:hypothetical protein